MYTLTINPKNFEVYPFNETEEGDYGIFFRREPLIFTEESLKKNYPGGVLVTTERGGFLVLPRDFDPRDEWFEPVKFGIHRFTPLGTWVFSEYTKSGLKEVERGDRGDYFYRLFQDNDFQELVSFEEKGSSYPVQFNWIEK